MDRPPTREEMNSLLRESVVSIQSTEKQLADLVIPPSLYELARSFVEITEFECRYHNPQVFILLLEASIEIHVLDEGEAELRKWREGLKALLQYPLNLLVAPNRPELKRIKVSTSFFTFQVQRNLKQAKSFLSLMGYEQVQNTTDFTLKRFSIDQVYLLVTDIVILHEDLEIISFLISRIAQWSRDLANAKIKFCHFFLTRHYGPADKMKCLDFILQGEAARCPLPPPSSSSSSPYSPSTSSTSSPTSQRYNRGNDQPYDSRVEERTRYGGSYSDDTLHNYPYNDEKGRLPSRDEYGYNDTRFDNRRDQYYGSERQRDQYYGGRYDQQRDTGYYANYQQSDYYGGQYQDAHYDQQRGYEHDQYPRNNYDDNYQGRDTYPNPQRWEEQHGDYRDDRRGRDYHRDEPRRYEGQRPPRDVNCDGRDKRDGRDGRYEDERTVRPVETNYEPESSFTSSVGDRSYSEKLQQVTKHYNQLQKKHDSLTESHDNLMTTHRQLQTSHDNLMTTQRQLQDSHDTLKATHHQLVTGLQQKNAEISQLQKSFETLTTSNYQLQNAHDNLAASNHEKEEELLHLQETHQQLVQRIEQTQVELSAKQEEVTILQKKVTETENSWKISHKDIGETKTELGRGGWGVIWIGEFRGQRVAVKHMHELIRSDENLKILHREINTMSQLRHPNLLQFIGAVLDHPSGDPMIITEVMDTSLRKAYESKELTPDPSCRPVILSIMRDVAVGLNYLHCLPDPIIHRDVSSANVLLESKGPRKWKTKISDFGSANFARAAVTAAPGAIIYSAPEGIATLYRKKKDQTTKMDSYSYGVLLCEVITCQFPDEEIFDGLLQQVKTSSSKLYELIVSCIHKKPEKRPTISHVIEQLDC